MIMRKSPIDGITAEERGRRIIKAVNSIVNFTVLTIFVLLVSFAGYALWDSKQIYRLADKSNYAVYKPTDANEGKTFAELQAINPEVIAWLTVYGTNIDYPVTQGQDNMKYINTNAEGLYSLSGSVFLDSDNSRDFSDFNSILYAHHMEKKAMFGEIGDFADADMFDTHKYGNLYVDGKNKGLEFFAFIHTDAYDNGVFMPGVGGEAKQVYIDGLFEKAMHIRDIGVSTSDRFVLLSTCSSNSTNGRDLLVARITTEVFSDPFSDPFGIGAGHDNRIDGSKIKDFYLWLPFLVFVTGVRIIVFLVSLCRRLNYGERS